MSGEQWSPGCAAASRSAIPFLLSPVEMLDVARIPSAYLRSETFVSAELGINDLLTNLISVLTGQRLAALTVFDRQSR